MFSITENVVTTWYCCWTDS